MKVKTDVIAPLRRWLGIYMLSVLFLTHGAHCQNKIFENPEFLVAASRVKQILFTGVKNSSVILDKYPRLRSIVDNVKNKVYTELGKEKADHVMSLKNAYLGMTNTFTNFLYSVRSNPGSNRTHTYTPYVQNMNNEIRLVSDVSITGDSETSRVLFTGFSPSDVQVFNPLYIENYATLFRLLGDIIFMRGADDPQNCKPHLPFLPDPQYGCSLFILVRIDDYEDISDDCSYADTLLDYLFFFWVYTIYLLCQIGALFTPLSFLTSLAFLVNGLPIETNAPVCYLRGLYRIGIIAQILFNVALFLFAAISAALISGLCSGVLDVRATVNRDAKRVEQYTRVKRRSAIESGRKMERRVKKLEEIMVKTVGAMTNNRVSRRMRRQIDISVE